jgi:hypothetical protein
MQQHLLVIIRLEPLTASAAAAAAAAVFEKLRMQTIIALNLWGMLCHAGWQGPHMEWCASQIPDDSSDGVLKRRVPW